jgi:hypothetical protein
MGTLMPRTDTESAAARSGREFEKAMAAREAEGHSLLTNLDAQETTPDAPPFPEGHGVQASHPLEMQSTFQKAAHAPHSQARWKIVNALWQPEVDDELRQRSQKMGCCCCLPSFRLNLQGKPVASLARCRDRLCPLCADRRGRQAAARTVDIVKRFNAPRFITLTLKHNQAPLAAELARLHESLKKLRAHKTWTKRVFGGVYGVEVTRSHKTASWHVHVHLIVDGEFFPHEVLKALWLSVTGDSFIVDIAIVKDRTKTARYISRYVSKPVDVDTWEPAEIREYALAMHGRRLLQTFGNAHNVKVDDDEPEVDHRTTTHLCSSAKLISAVAAGSSHAREASNILAAMSIDHAVACGITRKSGDRPPAPSPERVDYAIRVLQAVDAVNTTIASDRIVSDFLSSVNDADPHAAASIGAYLPTP